MYSNVLVRVISMHVIEYVVMRIITYAPHEVLNPSRARQSFTDYIKRFRTARFQILPIFQIPNTAVICIHKYRYQYMKICSHN